MQFVVDLFHNVLRETGFIVVSVL